MYHYLHYLEQTFPQSVSLMDIGSSSENRTLLVAKVSTGDPNVVKPAIWIDGGRLYLCKRWEYIVVVLVISKTDYIPIGQCILD